MPRFFCEPCNILNGRYVLNQEDSLHATEVLRMSKDEKITLCDGQGTDYTCFISSVGNGRVTVEITGTALSESEPNIKAVLFQCIAKGEKMDYIIQKSVELGVHTIIPVVSQRCVVKLDAEGSRKKQERWQKIARSAAMQSGRGIIPFVLQPVGFDNALALMLSYKNHIILYEGENKNRISDFISGDINDFAFMIGPEGGFDISEAKAAQKHGISPVTLGKRILRTETASGCVLSILMYITDNL